VNSHFLVDPIRKKEGILKYLATLVPSIESVAALTVYEACGSIFKEHCVEE
jgi:hypothetical protein